MGAVRAGNFKTVGLSNAQIIDGSLKFDKSKKNYLSRTPSAGNRAVWTWSAWIKRSGSISSSTNQRVFSARASDGSVTQGFLLLKTDDTLFFSDAGNSASLTTVNVLRDTGWFNIIVVCDTSLSSDRLKIYMNGVQLPLTGTQPTLNSTAGNFNSNIFHSISYDFYTGGNGEHCDFYLSQVNFIDGQALTPSSFGFTDPLTNTWRPKKYTGTYGTNGYYLPLDGNTPIGQDRSGNNNNWTAVNFGGSNTIEKATGALPILNTDGGGKVARVGVRTDSNASSLVLALPLVGIKSDFSNKINSGATEKAITANGAVATSSYSNFYGGSFDCVGNASTKCLDIADSADFAFASGDALTLECWIWMDSTYASTPRGVFQSSQQKTGGLSNAWFLSVYTSNQLLWGMHASATLSTPNNSIPTNVWTHIAICRDTSNNWTAYINGVSQTLSGSVSTTLSRSGTGAMVGQWCDGTSTLRPLNGYIQDFRLYKGVVKYTQNFIPASTDPDILPDTPSGVAYSSNVALVPSTDGAVAFDGSGDYLSLASSADFAFGTGDFTVEFWYYHISGNDRGLFANNSGASVGVNFLVGATANNLFRIYNGTDAYNLYDFSVSPVANTWQHLAVVRNSGTLTLYVNGVASGSTSWSGVNAGNTATFSVGSAYGDGRYAYGFISNFHLVKGTALYTSNFTPPTGPISSVANTKLLCCKSGISTTAFDVSPGTITANGNAKATNFNPFTVNINTQRGQESGYATLNPLRSTNSAGGGTISNGNLDISISGSNWYTIVANIVPNSGKWYAEFTKKDTSVYPMMGVIKSDAALPPSGIYEYIGYTATSWAYQPGSAVTYTNNATTSFGSANTTGTSMVAFDADTGKVWFGHDGNWIGGNPYLGTGASYTGLPSNITFAASVYSSSGGLAANFGQKPFKFPPPAGFQPLALANTPRPTIVRPDQYVGIVTYSGDGVDGRVISLPFKADMVMVKVRNQAGQDWVLCDSVRGSESVLNTNQTYSQTSPSNYGGVGFSVPFGFTLEKGQDVSNGHKQTNESTWTYVSWAWKAGGNSNTFNINDIGYSTASAAGLTAGTITPTGASVNTKSGFSIIKYAGQVGGGSWAHGLGQEPKFIIFKRYTTAQNWFVFHKITGSWRYFEGLNTTSGDIDYSSYMSASSTIVTLPNFTEFTTDASSNYVAYCWAEIPGFSKFGSWTNNNSTDGTFIQTNFRPAVILLKNSDNTENWYIYDSARHKYNVAPADSLKIQPNTNNAEGNGGGFAATATIDFLSNGFKIRTTNTASGEISFGTRSYIYAAFAESPSFNLYGGQSNAR